MAVELIHEPELDRIDSMYQLALKHENATDSPLLRLPSELRNRIYELALGDWQIWLDCDMTYLESGRLKSWIIGLDDDGTMSGTLPPYIGRFPSTCRQLYAETRLLIFSLNEIVVSNIWNMPGEFFEQFGQQRRDQIRSVRILVGEHYSGVDEELYEDLGNGFEKMFVALRGLRGLELVTIEWNLRFGAEGQQREEFGDFMSGWIGVEIDHKAEVRIMLLEDSESRDEAKEG